MRALVITVSDRAAAGVYADTGGPILVDGLRDLGFDVDGPVVVPDGEPVAEALRDGVDASYDVILTTGGTGLTPDRPDAGDDPRRCSTARCRASPRRCALSASRKAFRPRSLSRGLAGLAGRRWSSTCPGSPGGVRDGARRAAPAARARASTRSVAATTEVARLHGVRVGRSRSSRGGWRCGRCATGTGAWHDLRARNVGWLQPWEATPPDDRRRRRCASASWCASCRTEARAGRVLPFVITYDGELVGQLTVGGITGARCARRTIGYWVDQRVAGRGIDADRGRDGHRPLLRRRSGCTGWRSTSGRRTPRRLRVVEKLGFRDEGCGWVPAHRRRLARPPDLRADP